MLEESELMNHYHIFETARGFCG
ncbi:cysteine methyltransferase, partial [Sinorhizobium meliloti]